MSHRSAGALVPYGREGDRQGDAEAEAEGQATDRANAAVLIVHGCGVP